MACRKNSPGKPCCGPPDCESCCIGRIEVTIGTDEDTAIPLGEISWDIGTQPTTTLSTALMPDGKTQQVCTRKYFAPVSETICEGTAREADINIMLRTLDRDLDLAGRYSFAVADYTGTLGLRCNRIVSNFSVSVQWSSGWVRAFMFGNTIEEAFTFFKPGATRRAYSTSTCLGTGGVTTYVDDTPSVYCNSLVALNACPAPNPYAPLIIVPGYKLSAVSMDSGWIASASCEDGDFESDVYADFEYYVPFCPGPGSGQLPYTRTTGAAIGTCSENEFSQTFRDIEDAFVYRRNRIKTFLCT